MASTSIKTLTGYRYTISLQYLNVKRNIATQIKNECLKSLIIDHNYDVNTMPILYANLKLDKSLVDDMIRNQNDNLIVIALYKYDKNAEIQIETECFRKQFIYFLPDDVNKMDPVDYNDETNPTMKGDTFTSLTLGLLALEHVNNNKTRCEITVKDVTQYDIVKYITSHFKDLIIEPFSYNETWEQFVLPSSNADSVNKALKFLNNTRVFYSTPYRYYQDFNHTYIISSSGNAIKRSDEVYSSILLTIRDIDDVAANDTGVIINRSTGSYEVYINYANTQVYDNTLVNKSKSKIRGITSSGASDISLANASSYSKDKTVSLRLNNDNEHMIENLESQYNTENFLLYFSKNDLDTDLFTINKRISIHNIDRYREFNGNYLLYRKREIYLREDSSFIMNSMINLRRIDSSNVKEVATTRVHSIGNPTPVKQQSTQIYNKPYNTSSGSLFVPSSR